MFDVITIFRLLLIPIGIGSVFLLASLTKPPKIILYRALRLCWIMGVLNFLVDVIQQESGFWHYTANYLVYGYPLDLYITVSLVAGCSIPLFYLWMLKVNSKWRKPFVFLLPFYFLLQDYVVIKVTDNKVMILDSSYWWISDLVSLTIISWGIIFLFRAIMPTVVRTG